MAEAENFLDLPLEEVLGDRFGRYSKYIIQERALPDARDGLKPVQRRILYAMNEENNTYDKNFRKSAKTVGTVIGNYHPHGDTSVYDAMVRLSQEWKVRNSLVEMHGNNGSIDGDPPAAMRYTEARLSKIASELLRDINKETVDWVPNFDDTINEPVVLPAKYPNLLVNGSTGISAGYATDIPPHNLAEVIDAVIKKIDKPAVTVDELMQVIKGPDFPTGGTIQGIDGIRKAYETGKGRIVVRGRAFIEDIRGGRQQIVIDEIPYDVNKANMVKKIDEMRIDKKVEGIAEVRDETDRTGLRVVIELKKGASSEGVLKYLYKNSDLQVTYNFNMVAIKDKTPKQLSLPQILDSYIAHQKDVVTRQTVFDLNKAKKRSHIVEGLIKAVSILDELIATIRASKDKQDAKKRIIHAYAFSEAQAEAIVTLQLYRLTNTDVTALEREASELEKQIDQLETLLSSDRKLFQHIKKELRAVKRAFSDERQTVIENEIEALTIDIEVTVASEDVVVSVTRDGYVKRTSLRSYGASNGDDPGIKDDDYLVSLLELNTTDQVLLFTSKGKYIYLPIHELPDIRWKDVGQHISNLVSIDRDERIIQSIPVRSFQENAYLIFFTRNGMVKRSNLTLYKAQRYSRALVALNLKNDDEVVGVYKTKGNSDVFIGSNTGAGLWYHESEISVVGQRAVGVKALKLKDGEYVVNGQVFDEWSEPSIVVVTHRGAAKQMKLKSFEKSSRAKRGQIMLRELKNKAHRLVGLYAVSDNDTICFKTHNNELHSFFPLELSVSDRYSNGSFLIDSDNQGEVTEVWKIPAYEKPFDGDQS
ncbi:DNA topoisomerase IV subunit A [Lentibacillus persicus]|uniref:DNA topoisomerase 4 subunit A n=1 Tax=Lentibacillus persicus TaxID=640948 RepID=A0A1I1V554_9BACI|nr:DNA topoisomerase IV subunit A [Lentibacillus persicus]SFD78034.1 DNA topoisomerase IV subunit A [Lentibacillus persicus]